MPDDAQAEANHLGFFLRGIAGIARVGVLPSVEGLLTARLPANQRHFVSRLFPIVFEKKHFPCTLPMRLPAGANVKPGETKLNRVSSIANIGLGVAALALGQAVQNGNGGFTPAAILWLTVALIGAGVGLAAQYRAASIFLQQSFQVVLTLGIIWQIYQLLTTLPGIYLWSLQPSEFWRFQAVVLIAGCLALFSLAPEAWLSSQWRNSLVGLTLITIFGLGVWVIHASPSPFIDTYVFNQTSSAALLHGQNPYELAPPNIYRNMGFYGAELVKDGKMTIGNPYPPLSIYLSALGFVAGGDVRYSHLLAIVIAGALIAYLHPGREARLAAYIFLFTPRVFFVVEQSWTEPLVLLCVVLTVFCAVHRPTLIPLALGLLLASKQYMLLMLPLTILLIPPKTPWRGWARLYGWAGGLAVAVTAPLALWNVSAFLWNVGWAQWYQVFRLDALSYVALYARAFGQQPSQFIAFIALLLALLFAWRYARRSPAGFVAALAWSLGVFFAFSKQAFCNYYFLIIGALCCAFAALPPREISQKPIERAPHAAPLFQ